MVNNFTLDTNCLISLGEDRSDAPSVRRIVNAHIAGTADVAVVAISASERQQGNFYLKDFSVFEARLAAIGLANIPLICPMGYYDITFFDKCLRCDQSMKDREREIHTVLFPGIEFQFNDFCAARGIPSDVVSPPHKKWRNAKCDVQLLWAHDNAKRDVLVTGDKNFLGKAEAISKLGAGRVMSPEAASNLI